MAGAKDYKAVEDLIARIRKACGNDDAVFRGEYQDYETPASSELYRKHKKSGIFDHDYYQPGDVEKEIVEKARREAFPAGTSTVDILTDLRYLGVDTAVVDFSKDMLVALFFACNGEPEKNEKSPSGRVWVLPVKDMEELTSDRIHDENRPEIGFIAPGQTAWSRGRVESQSSIFVHARQGFVDKKRMKEIKIPHELKQKCLAYLEKFHNISDGTIYKNLIDEYKDRLDEYKDLIDEYKDSEFNKVDISEILPADIFAYNELLSCADLARMTEDGVIDLQPDFQRDVVWNSADQTRFIDSLVKQLPIPSMCFAFDYTTDKWLVVDGLQRMTSIVNFLQGGDWHLSRLADIDPRLADKPASSFKTGKGKGEKRIFDKIQNKTLPITVLRCKFSNQKHMEYLFTVFHRLNAGGTKLNNQEIRNCIYSGSFNNLLRELDNYPPWRTFNMMADGKSYRFVKQEVILRIFAFGDQLEKYTGQIGKFLNGYMHTQRNLDDEKIQGKRDSFKQTCDIVSKLFPDKPPERFSTALTEALFVGIMKNLDRVKNFAEGELESRFNELRTSDPFNEENLAEGLSKKSKVDDRMNQAIAIFSQ